MPDLERTLHALGADLDWPAAPGLADAVHARLSAEREPPPRRLVLVAAVALLAVALAAALLVPQARTSILRFFHLGGVTVERVDRLPPTRPLAPYWLGAPSSLDAAGRLLGQPLPLPAGERPDGVYVDGTSRRNAIVNLRYGPPARPRLLVSEFLTSTLPVVEKYVAGGTGVNRVTVAGRRGLWIDASHAVRLGILPSRLSAGALLWQSGDLTIRLEAGVSKQEALELARTFRR